MRNAHIGKCFSEEHRKSLRENHSDRRGEKHHHAKLKEKDAINIKEILGLNIYSCKEIGKVYGVSEGTISDIKLGRTWKHIK